MENAIITFQVNEQNLVKTGGIDNYASDTVSYIKAVFDLGTNWDSFDSVRAMWRFGSDVYATVLDSDGSCLVPHEILTKRGEVKVNLVGSIAEGDILTDRLTSFPIVALIITKIAVVDGQETAEITPSQFEQYVAIVKADADRAETARDEAEASQVASENAQTASETAQRLAENAQASAETAQRLAEEAQASAEVSEANAKVSEDNAEHYAELAEQSATEAGYVQFDIDENGNLIFTKTEYTELNFYISNGNLYLEVA